MNKGGVLGTKGPNPSDALVAPGKYGHADCAGQLNQRFLK